MEIIPIDIANGNLTKNIGQLTIFFTLCFYLATSPLIEMHQLEVSNTIFIRKLMLYYQQINLQ